MTADSDDRFRPRAGRSLPLSGFGIADRPVFNNVGLMSEDNLTWLSQWYLAHCDNDWEHSYGVMIETLDNPGWSLKIDLTDTPMQGRKFERLEHGSSAQDLDEWRRTGSWWVAHVEGNVFAAACGPLDLSTAVGVFRQWVEASA